MRTQLLHTAVLDGMVAFLPARDPRLQENIIYNSMILMFGSISCHSFGLKMAQGKTHMFIHVLCHSYRPQIPEQKITRKP